MYCDFFLCIKLIGKNGNIIFDRDILSDIQPYYIKVFTSIQEKRIYKRGC